MNRPTALRVGILLNEMSVQRWQLSCIEHLRSDDRISISLLILPEEEDEEITPQKKWSERLDKTALYKIWRKYFHWVSALETESPEWMQEIPIMRSRVEERKYSQYFSDDDIRKIKSHELDFILRFGFNILRGDVLKSAKYGIWSFHHGDEQLYRGGPPGFWELMHGRSSCGAILQRLTETLDGGVILKKGHFAVQSHSLEETHGTLLENSAAWPLQVARDILNGVCDPNSLEPVKTNAPVYRFPKNGAMIGFVFKLFANKARFHYRDLFCPEQWNVGIVDQPIEEMAENGIREVRWLPKQSAGKFRADAFGFKSGKGEIILFEDYDYRNRKGIISGVDDAGKMLRIFPAHDHHLSYPFIFEFEGEMHCIPESFEIGALTVYRWNPENFSFEKFRQIMESAELTDPTLVEIDGTWWLFCTPKKHSNSALLLFHAPSPFGPFEPHTNNPVKWDVRSARPGGTPFMRNGTWYRPAQDCSDTYGAKVVINRIEKISPIEYRESFVKTIEPESPYSKGLHTLSRWGNRTLIDGKRFRFNRHHFWYQIKRKLKRLG